MGGGGGGGGLEAEGVQAHWLVLPAPNNPRKMIQLKRFSIRFCLVLHEHNHHFE